MNFQDPAPTGARNSALETAPEHQRRRVAVIAGVVALAILGALVAFQLVREARDRARLSRPAIPLAVSFETAAPRPLPQHFSSIGSLAAINRATLSAEVGGAVTKVVFTPGARVKQGDLLIQLNDSAEVADLATFRAQQRVAQLALERARQLERSGNTSRAALDQAQSQFDVAAAGIAHAEAAIAKKAIRAPFDGSLGLNLVNVGEYVNAGTPVAALSDNSRLYVHFTLPEQARAHIAVGQTLVIATDAVPGRTFEASLAVIDPEIDEVTRAVHLHGIIDNGDGPLMSGMYANVQVNLPPLPDVLTVPETSVAYALSGNALFLAVPAGEGKTGLIARKVAVSTGEVVDGRVVIARGIKPGDQVITTGLNKLFDGNSVTLRDATPLVAPETLPRP